MRTHPVRPEAGVAAAFPAGSRAVQVDCAVAHRCGALGLNATRSAHSTISTRAPLDAATARPFKYLVKTGNVRRLAIGHFKHDFIPAQHG